MPVINAVGGGGAVSATFIAENVKKGVTITYGDKSVTGTMPTYTEVTAAQYAALDPPDADMTYVIME